MASLKRWRRVGQGQFHKWEQAGEEFEGTWRGAHDGRYGPLGTLETSEGLITFPLPAALLDRLRRVGEGAEVLIQYTGLQTSKAGRAFKGFEVYVAGDGMAEAPAEPRAVTAQADSPRVGAPARRRNMASSVMALPRSFDRARFYTIDGQRWPSVTTVLDIIAKPALGPWYAKEERRYLRPRCSRCWASPAREIRSTSSPPSPRP